MSIKRYGYTYDDSPMAAQPPLTEEEILRQVGNGVSDPRKWQIYELVPVKLVSTIAFKLERE